MTDIYSGDPRLILTVNGAEMEFIEGQPVMDQGLENQALISLFTEEGWFGNSFLSDEAQQVGADYVELSRGTITLDQLEDIRQSAVNALDYDGFGDVEVEVENPAGYRVNVKITIRPPGQDAQELILQRSGLNWIEQAENPANARITK